jgi:small acid-soluble spore protein P (minor)
MPKDIPQPVHPPTGAENQEDRAGTVNEPLSGSKKVKDRNHTRHNNGEG